jgi:hypothetical protein
MATRYFCDKCNTQVSNKDRLTEVISKGSGGSIRADLCQPCTSTLKIWLAQKPDGVIEQ